MAELYPWSSASAAEDINSLSDDINVLTTWITDKLKCMVDLTKKMVGGT
jgi:hypothetical protein